ncbi:Nicotinamidase [Meyerozyma sp. JA9]|nr:Nicotinamidase [Meyerozyma sp. JA9]
MEKLALVIVDLQNDFLPPNGSLAIPGGNEIISNIINLLDPHKYRFSAVIATQDWHPSDHCSFASQHGLEPYSSKVFEHPENKKDEDGKVLTLNQTLWPDHCIQNTEGAQLESEFEKHFNKLQVPHTVIKKGYLKDREYYSCFGDCWGLHHTEIDQYLKDNGITDVVFAGLAYDYCVLQSAIDSVKKGYKTYVVKEACKNVYPQKMPLTDNMYRSHGITVTHMKEFFLTKFQ